MNLQSGELIRVSACPRPFDLARADYAVPAGLTIAEIVEIVQPDPVLRACGHVFIDDALIERAHWHRVRPRPGHIISIRILPAGGGALRIGLMALVAVVAIVTTALTWGSLGPVWATALGSAISLTGTLLVNTFVPPPLPEVSKDNGKDSPSYAITGQRNTAQQWGKVPFLAGRFKITPPYAALPYREIVGGEIFWRALFAFSHGPIHIEQMAIGETDLGNFKDVAIEFRRGYWTLTDRGGWNAATGAFPTSPAFGDTWTCVVGGSAGGVSFAAGTTITFNGLGDPSLAGAWDTNQGKPFSLFPNDVYEEGLNLAVKYGTPQVRTSQIAGDELGIEIVFERGLAHIENFPAGHKQDSTVVLRIEQAPSGTTAWATVTQQTIVGRQATPLYWGYAWNPSAIATPNAVKSWDVRIHRLVPDMDEERNFGNFTWIALRTITIGDPAPVPGVAMMAMRIRSSEQLTGQIDTFNVVARTIARDFNSATGAWDWRPTSQPAALFRHILQHPSREKPATDAQLDLARLAYWDGVTRPAAREFNGIFEAKGSLFDALIKIARVGRAAPTLRDLKFSVVIDEPKTAPVRLFTPRNSWAYEGEMSHAEAPHGFRIGYVDAAQDYRTDEVVVYDDGYSASNAVRIDKVEWPGISSRDQAWREGRYHIAQQRLRREVHRINVDFEHLACERGDLVAFSHDTIAVGITSARVASRLESGDKISEITLDQPVTIAGGQFYGVRCRRVVSGVMRTDLFRLKSYPGTSARLVLLEPPAIIDAPQVGDLVAFGVWQRETVRLLVRDIEPGENLSARLTMIAEAPGVHLAENQPIPPYDPGATVPEGLPAPIVLGIRSDARVMQVTASRALIERVVFTLQPISIDGVRLIVLYRLAGTSAPFQAATLQDASTTAVALTGLQSGETYDFRLQYAHDSFFSSPVTAINSYYVIGRTGAPDDLQNLSLSVVGGQALLRWDLPADLDVQFGGWIMIRHSPDLEATLWPDSTSIAQAVVGNQTHVYLPLKPGTYFARVYDADGRPSAGVAYASTKQASVLAFTPVADVQEDPDFTGTKTRCEVVSSGLMLIHDTFAGVPAVSALDPWSDTGGNVGSGLYEFAAGIDQGSVTRSRITSHILLTAINEHDYWDSKPGLIDSWPDIDGTIGAAVDAAVWGKLTDDDPAGTPEWGAFLRIDSAEIEARAIGELECRMFVSDRAFNLWLTQLRVAAEEIA